MKTLFDEEIIVCNPTAYKPPHDKKGRFTNKTTEAVDKAERRALIAENKVDYFQSVNSGMWLRLRQAHERILELELSIK